MLSFLWFKNLDSYNKDFSFSLYEGRFEAESCAAKGEYGGFFPKTHNVCQYIFYEGSCGLVNWSPQEHYLVVKLVVANDPENQFGIIFMMEPCKIEW